MQGCGYLTLLCPAFHSNLPLSAFISMGGLWVTRQNRSRLLTLLVGYRGGGRLTKQLYRGWVGDATVKRPIPLEIALTRF